MHIRPTWLHLEAQALLSVVLLCGASLQAQAPASFKPVVPKTWDDVVDGLHWKCHSPTQSVHPSMSQPTITTRSRSGRFTNNIPSTRRVKSRRLYGLAEKQRAGTTVG